MHAHHHRLRTLRFGAALALSLTAVPLAAFAVQPDHAKWDAVKNDLFADRPMADGSRLLRIDAPERAQDAGLVPITIEALSPQRADWHIKTITLVVDNNPWPVAAVFRPTPESGLASIGTRIRINEYSHVRAIAELSDGSLHHVSRYVKASGGCSAPALKNEEQAASQMGKMLLRHHPAKAVLIQESGKPGAVSEVGAVTLHIRHPNFSGMQKHATENFTIPEHYVENIEVRQGGKTVLTVEGSIALSEDPTVKFHFDPKNGAELDVHVEDSKGGVYDRTWPSTEKPAREAAAKGL